MRFFAIVGLLLGAIALGVNPGTAGDLTIEDQRVLKDLRKGDMGKLVVHREPRPRIEEGWRDQYGNAISLEDYSGKVVLLNFWATWCPPCRKEMPGIDRLAGELGGEDLAVIPLSMDRFDVERVVDFFEEIDVQHLGIHQDRSGATARRAGALGLPVTLILDRDGREIARLAGEAEWDGPNAKAILTRVIEMTAPST